MSYILGVHRSPEDHALLFDVPIGAISTVRTYWWEPAQMLNLPLIAGLQTGNVGLAGTDLDKFGQELSVLSDHLEKTVPDGPTRTHRIGGRDFSVPLLVDLIRTIGDVHSAVRLAQAIGGYVTIVC